MLGAFLFLNEAQSFPGWLAAIPTLGSALVIASPGFAPGRDCARQSRRRFFRRDLLSALFVALAAVRLRPHLARRHPDGAGSACAGVRGGGSRRAHLRLDRAAGRDSVSPPAVRDCAGARWLARADRNRRQADLRFQGLSLPFSAARRPHFRLRRQRRGKPPLLGCFYQRDEARYSLDEERRRERRASSRPSIARRSRIRGSRRSSLSATRTPPISSPACRRSTAPRPIS